jgi:hypothetical protein
MNNYPTDRQGHHAREEPLPAELEIEALQLTAYAAYSDGTTDPDQIRMLHGAILLSLMREAGL